MVRKGQEAMVGNWVLSEACTSRCPVRVDLGASDDDWLNYWAIIYL
jgi:hypothetical protein